ncbi:hypothetical protein RIF29_13691 [Crotalaria pallida]|uniref:Uncharacterized protein n=1 Tax=Crotalaria pallida TaxID=3830 RepID=A0AAN9P395_CROPI
MNPTRSKKTGHIASNPLPLLSLQSPSLSFHLTHAAFISNSIQQSLLSFSLTQLTLHSAPPPPPPRARLSNPPPPPRHRRQLTDLI